MPTNQPSSAPDDLPVDARDPATPGAVLNDDRLDKAPGGGGLGGQGAADPLEGSARTPRGTAPNAPIDVPTPDTGTDASPLAGAEARVRATESDTPEPHPRAQ